MKIKKCPFCGSTKAPHVMTAIDVNDCKKCSTDDCFTVCCDIFRGGCGGASGYDDSKNEAIKKWNQRKRTKIDD